MIDSNEIKRENNHAKDDNMYYCYSYRQAYFLRAFNAGFVGSNVNTFLNKRFWKFKKSERLNNIIAFYTEVKDKFGEGDYEKP